MCGTEIICGSIVFVGATDFYLSAITFFLVWQLLKSLEDVSISVQFFFHFF